MAQGLRKQKGKPSVDGPDRNFTGTRLLADLSTAGEVRTEVSAQVCTALRRELIAKARGHM